MFQVQLGGRKKLCMQCMDGPLRVVNLKQALMSNVLETLMHTELRVFLGKTACCKVQPPPVCSIIRDPAGVLLKLQMAGYSYGYS